MKNALLIVSVLFVAIISTACINNFAVQELNNKAGEYLAKGDYNSAIGRLEASIDIDPTIFETNYNLGIACISAEQYEKAVTALTNAASIRTDMPDVYYSLAVAQYNYAEDILAGKNNNSNVQQPAVYDENAGQSIEIISTEDMQKANQYYGMAVKSLEKYLTFSELEEQNKVSANSQLSSIKIKIEDLQAKLPKTEPISIPSGY